MGDRSLGASELAVFRETILIGRGTTMPSLVLLKDPPALLRHGREILTSIVVEIERQGTGSKKPGHTAAGGPRRGRRWDMICRWRVCGQSLLMGGSYALGSYQHGMRTRDPVRRGLGQQHAVAHQQQPQHDCGNTEDEQAIVGGMQWWLDVRHAASPRRRGRQACDSRGVTWMTTGNGSGGQ